MSWFVRLATSLRFHLSSTWTKRSVTRFRPKMEQLNERVMPAADALGVFRPGEVIYDTGAPGYQNEAPIRVGQPGDQVISGDWDGDGKSEVGFFRNGAFFLQGQAPFAFGLNGDKAIAGDWNHDGKDDVGVFRSGPGIYTKFFLDMGPRGYQGSHPFELSGIDFGLVGDQPIAGDWDGDGTDQVGIFRNGEFYLDLGDPGYQNEQPIAFGLPGDRAIAGDWNGDGYDQVGVFRNGHFYRDLDAPGYQGETPIAFGLAGDQPIVGNWDTANTGDAKGVQAVLLARWSSTSVANFLSVMKDARAPKNLEIGFVPVFNRSNQYGNAIRVVDSLIASGKTVTVTVHLGFHLGDSLTSPNPTLVDTQLRNLRSDAKVFNDQFLARYAGNGKVIIQLST